MVPALSSQSPFTPTLPAISFSTTSDAGSALSIETARWSILCVLGLLQVLMGDYDSCPFKLNLPSWALIHSLWSPIPPFETLWLITSLSGVLLISFFFLIFKEDLFIYLESMSRRGRENLKPTLHSAWSPIAGVGGAQSHDPETTTPAKTKCWLFNLLRHLGVSYFFLLKIYFFRERERERAWPWEGAEGKGGRERGRLPAECGVPCGAWSDDPEITQAKNQELDIQLTERPRCRCP